MSKRLVWAYLTVFALVACKSIPCHDQDIAPVFIGFATSDVDTIIIRKYQMTDNFSHLLDTAIITNDKRIAWYVSSHDTTIVVLDIIGGEKKKYLIPGYDWQIYLPSLQRTDSIQHIVSPQVEDDCVKCTCWNPINSFKQNGIPVVPVQVNHDVLGNTYPAYIHK